jgi:hypothetical protein
MHPQGWNEVEDPALAGLQLTAAGLAGSAAHPDHPGSATIRRRAVSAASIEYASDGKPRRQLDDAVQQGTAPRSARTEMPQSDGFADGRLYVVP